VAALLAGAFLALAVPPGLSLTGGVGHGISHFLVRVFGVGAAAFPLIPLFWAVALFGHLPEVAPRRVTILLAGLAIAVPFTLAVIYQYSDPAVRADLASGNMYVEIPPVIGVVGALLAFGLRFVGPVGEGLIAVGAFSALTISTVGWNPLGKLKKRDQGEKGEKREKGRESLASVADVESEPPPLEIEPEPEPDETEDPAGIASRASRKKREPKPKPLLAKVIGSIMPSMDSPAADQLPPLDILEEPKAEPGNFEAELDRLQKVLLETLRQFKVEAKAGARTTGPVVTQYEIIPEAGVKVGRISALADDIALAMKAQSIRIVAPIPGRGAVGIEVPNPKRKDVGLRKLLESDNFQGGSHELPIALGEDLEGHAIVADLAKMPHLLIAGATGSGKSVCINTIITSLVYRLTKERLRLLMIDPKMVELAIYKDLPHLRHSVVTDNKEAAKVFKWAVWEMQDRYELLHANAARNIMDFNRKVAAGTPLKDPKGEAYTTGALPYIVLVVDELADLMMTVQSEIETPLAQLAQKARAIGIHVVLATQRPSVNVITGLIKANFPSRIAFRVAAKVDSRTILDQNGAEALLGYGDMLFLPAGKNDPQRVQGAYIATEETERLMAWFEAKRQERIQNQKDQEQAQEPDVILEANRRAAEDAAGADGRDGSDGGDGGDAGADRDKLFRQAAEICIQAQGGSTSLLQRRLKIGYGRAARLIDQLEDAGVLGPMDGPRGRDVLMGLDELERFG
jgi:S-DNA-T family DNA segregation ATPase FtsK/SpoIIIE